MSTLNALHIMAAVENKTLFPTNKNSNTVYQKELAAESSNTVFHSGYPSLSTLSSATTGSNALESTRDDNDEPLSCSAIFGRWLLVVGI